MFRESQGIKRAVLATEANVSEKTIERARAVKESVKTRVAESHELLE